MCPISLSLDSLNLLYRLLRIFSLSHPAASRDDAISRVPGNTELPKLFVSVVIPVINASMALGGRLHAFLDMSGIFISVW